MNFFSIWAMLGDTNGWIRVGRYETSDEVEHRSGVRFFTDCGGVRFRVGKEIVYEPNLFAWLLIGFRVRRLVRALNRKQHPESPPESSGRPEQPPA